MVRENQRIFYLFPGMTVIKKGFIVIDKYNPVCYRSDAINQQT